MARSPSNPRYERGIFKLIRQRVFIGSTLLRLSEVGAVRISSRAHPKYWNRSAPFFRQNGYNWRRKWSSTGRSVGADSLNEVRLKSVLGTIPVCDKLPPDICVRRWSFPPLTLTWLLKVLAVSKKSLGFRPGVDNPVGNPGSSLCTIGRCGPTWIRHQHSEGQLVAHPAETGERSGHRVSKGTHQPVSCGIFLLISGSWLTSVQRDRG